MKFSKEELFFLSNTLSKECLFGLNLQVVSDNQNTVMLQNILNGLRLKNLIDEKDEITKWGALVLDALKEYKEAKNHLIINKLHIALNKEKNAVVIIPMNADEYELLKVPPTAILLQVIKEYPFTQCEEQQLSNEETSLDLKEFLFMIQQSAGSVLTIGEYREGVARKESMYLFNQESCQECDLLNEKSKYVTSRQIRMRLLEALHIREINEDE